MGLSFVNMYSWRSGARRWVGWRLWRDMPWATATKPASVAVTVGRPHDAGKEADRG